MLASIRSLTRIRPTSRLLYRNYITSSEVDSNFEHVNDLGFRNPYSTTDNQKILSIINRSSTSEMRKFNLSQTRLNRLVQRREKYGEFTSIEDMLEIEGFGIKILEKFCDSIIQADLKQAAEDNNQEYQELLLNQKARKDSYVSPALLEVVRGRINSIVSFHIDLNFFAWSKICYSPNETANGKFYIEEWHCHEIGQFDRKPNLSSMSSLLVQLLDQIPHADAYVIEALPMVNTAQGGAAQIIVNVQKAQFYAMLCALMTSRKSLMIQGDQSPKAFFDNMFFLKSFLTSRFYKYLIGSEKVATEQIMELIFQYHNHHHQEMPKLESIDIPRNFIDHYRSSKAVEKEYLGNSLLVGLTFMKLCIQKCPKCIGTLKTRSSP